MAPQDVARTLLAVAGTTTGAPGIGLEHLVIRSPATARGVVHGGFCRAGCRPAPIKERPMAEYDPFDWRPRTTRSRSTGRSATRHPSTTTTEVGFYALSRYDDVVAATSTRRRSPRRTASPSRASTSGSPFLIVKDPPEHTWHRKIVSRVFTPRRIAALEPFIRRDRGRPARPVRDADRFDVVEDFSFRLPLDVISELIGIPGRPREEVHQL